MYVCIYIYICTHTHTRTRSSKQTAAATAAQAFMRMAVGSWAPCVQHHSALDQGFRILVGCSDDPKLPRPCCFQVATGGPSETHVGKSVCPVWKRRKQLVRHLWWKFHRRGCREPFTLHEASVGRHTVAQEPISPASEQNVVCLPGAQTLQFTCTALSKHHIGCAVCEDAGSQ